jgi:Ras family protein A
MTHAPVILVGCKKDLRDNPEISEGLLPQSEAYAVASRVGALRYFECSARTGEGVKDLFEYVALAAMTYQPKLKRTKTEGWRRLFSRSER